MKAFLTFDFFLHDWGTPNGQLWLWVQPCVPSESLEKYLGLMLTPEGLDFDLLQPTNEECGSQEGLVPVPFPAGLDLSLLLHPGGPPLVEIPRRTRLKVLKPECLLELNSRERVTGEDAVIEDQPEECDAGRFLPSEGEPFARTYERMLLAAIDPTPACRVSGVELADFLRLALWMGSRWVISPEAVEGASADPALMDLPGLPGASNERTTNLHSLLGHLFCLGGSAQIAGLAASPALTLKLVGPAGSARELPLVPAPEASRLATYLSTVDAVVADPGRVIQASWNCRAEDPREQLEHDLDRRVYARPRSVTFSRRELGNAFPGERVFSMIRREGAGAGPDDKEARSLRWLRIVPEKDVFDPRPSLHLRLVDTYRVQLLAYRKAPKAGWPTGPKEEPDPWCLVAIVPEPQEAAAFTAEAAGDGAVPPGFRLLDAAFQPVAFEPIGWVRFLADEHPVLLVGVPASVLSSRGEGGAGAAAPDTGTCLALFDRGARIRADWEAAGARSGGFWRWDSTGPEDAGRPAGKFDSLVVENPDAFGSAAGVQVAVSASFEGDCDYQLARSLSRIEGVLGVAFRETGSSGAQADFDEDARNFSALNVFASDAPTSGGTPAIERHLNVDSELYPVFRRCDASPWFQWYHFVYRMPGRFASVSAADVRKDLRDVYFNRRRRSLRLTVEHALGAEHELPDAPSLSSRLDFPVALPMDVGDDREPNETAGSEGVRHLLTVERRAGATDDLGALVVRLRTEWLHPPAAEKRTRSAPGEKDTSSKRWARYTAAWAAVAEIAAADEVRLDLVQYGYDRARAQGSRTDSGWACLATSRIGDVESAKLVASCRAWLDGETLPPSGEWTVTVPLSSVTRSGDLGCARLTVRRPRELFAEEATDFTLVRTRDRKASVQADGDQDHRAWDVELVPQGDPDRSGLGRWVEGLRTRRGAVPGSGKTHDQGRTLLQAAGAILEEADESSVFLLGSLRNASPGALAEVTVCPLAFEPVGTDEHLGPATMPVLRKYFEAIDEALAFGLAGHLVDVPGAWRDRVRRIEERIPDLRALLGEASCRLRPAYEAVEGEVSGMADLLRTLAPNAENAEVRGALLAWVDRALAASPSVWGSAKAVQYTCAYFPGHGGVPRDLVSARTVRVLDTAREGAPRVVRAGLEAVPPAASIPGWLGFLEVLPDADYGGSFLYTTERDVPPVALEPLATGLADSTGLQASASAYGLRFDRIELPDGWMAASDAASRFRVRLPSREPLVDPVLAWSGNLKGAEESIPEAFLKLGDAISRTALLSGRLSRAAGEADRMRVLAKTSDPIGTPGVDEVVVSAVFVVRTDEDGSVVNDLFRIANGPPPPAPATAPPPPDALGLFFDLLQWNAGNALPRPERLFDPEVISTVRRMLSREPGDGHPRGVGDIENHLACLVPRGDCLEVEGFPPGTLEAYLLEPATPMAQGAPEEGGARALVLLVSRRFSIWRRRRISLQQLRNEATETAETRPFAGPFRSGTSAVGGEEVSCATQSGRWSRDPVRLKRSCTAASLVEAWGPMDPLWRTARLSVTVFEIGRVDLPAERVEDPSAGEEIETVHEDRFPVIALGFLPRAVDGPADQREIVETWFPEPYRRFAVDLQWYSESNEQLLRLNGMLVEIEA